MMSSPNPGLVAASNLPGKPTHHVTSKLLPEENQNIQSAQAGKFSKPNTNTLIQSNLKGVGKRFKGPGKTN